MRGSAAAADGSMFEPSRTDASCMSSEGDAVTQGSGAAAAPTAAGGPASMLIALRHRDISAAMRCSSACCDATWNAHSLACASQQCT